VEADVSRFGRRQKESDLEAQLRRDRPQPPAELMQSLTERVVGESRRPLRSRAKIAVVGIPLVAMLVAFGAFGGIGYAASAFKTAVVTAKGVVVAPLETRKFASIVNNKRNVVNTDKKGGDGGKPDDKEYGHKKKMCHHKGPKDKPPREVTIEVADSAVPAHLAHGDTLGECHKPKEPKH
jgi:hypothetical protein